MGVFMRTCLPYRLIFLGILMVSSIGVSMRGMAEVASSPNYGLTLSVVANSGGVITASSNTLSDAVGAETAAAPPAASASFTLYGGFVQPWSTFTGVGEGEGEAVYHTADQTEDNDINFSELLRIIQFYNSDGLHCENGTEDGYAPNGGDQSCMPHDSDYNPQDWFVNLSELLRTIQFYNIGGYTWCPDVDPPTEDSFCPGPP